MPSFICVMLLGAMLEGIFKRLRILCIIGMRCVPCDKCLLGLRAEFDIQRRAQRLMHQSNIGGMGHKPDWPG